MKRSRLSYDEWKCITSSSQSGKVVNNEAFAGYVGLLSIQEVSEEQIWEFHGEQITVCAQGLKWLSILPSDDYYCITAMFDEKGDILLWYIDMIAGQGMDQDGIPYFDDLYLDLIVYPDGMIKLDDMDELRDALVQNDITQQQFDLAIHTCLKLQDGLLSDINLFRRFTNRCFAAVS